jgi:hypothetical protein
LASAPSRSTAAAIAGDQGLPQDRRMQFLKRPEAENIGPGAKSMPSFIAHALSATGKLRVHSAILRAAFRLQQVQLAPNPIGTDQVHL